MVLGDMMFYLDILTVLYYHNSKEDPDLCILPCYSPTKVWTVSIQITTNNHHANPQHQTLSQTDKKLLR